MAGIIGLLVVGFIALQVINKAGSGGGGFFNRFYHVPDGESWQAFYRQLRDKQHQGGTGRWLWILIGLGVGSAAVVLLLMFVAR